MYFNLAHGPCVPDNLSLTLHKMLLLVCRRWASTTSCALTGCLHHLLKLLSGGWNFCMHWGRSTRMQSKFPRDVKLSCASFFRALVLQSIACLLKGFSTTQAASWSIASCRATIDEAGHPTKMSLGVVCSLTVAWTQCLSMSTSVATVHHRSQVDPGSRSTPG